MNQLIRSYKAFDVVRPWRDENGHISFTHGDTITIDHLTTYTLGDVESAAHERNEDPAKARARAEHLGHVAVWAYQDCVALTAHEQRRDFYCQVEIGTVFHYRPTDEYFRIESARNKNIRLVEVPRPEPAKFTVAIFLVARAYGGPEEGGWYFEAGEPFQEYAHLTGTFTTEAAANIYRDALVEEVVTPENKNYPAIYSVISDGVLRAIVSEGEPKPFPRQRPHYE